MKSVKLILMLMIFPIGMALPQDLQGTVTEIIDGNTLHLETLAGEVYKILLHGIDSPEPGQKYADQSTEMLKKLLLKKQVTIAVQGRDRHGNRVGAIQANSGLDPRHEMLRSGLAWTAEKQPDPELEAIRQEAQKKNVGIWEEENPTPPWTYRRQQTMINAKAN